MSQEKPRGTVLVIGGGIAGIQAALSLSGAGYGVHLVERTASLGGMIPNLHRIYPICTCCKLDPRTAACEQDPNINVMFNTEVKNLSGDQGHFSVGLETEGKERSLEVGAVILAGGIETFDPAGHGTYPYDRLPNLVTSVEYEQRQRPLGPEEGILKRPSDGKMPEKIAWLQCVGSRDINRCDAPYCSSVCCMYALKETLTTKDFNEDIETTIFYMDMRANGKGFEEYLNNAVARDVRLIRSRVHTVDNLPGTDDLLIIYVDETGGVREEVFDMVVLSVGLRPAGEAIEVAKKIGVNLSPDQFINTEPFRPVSTNIPGIFVCGGLGGPQDIGQSVTQATASVSEIASFLEPDAFSAPREYPGISEVGDKEPLALFAYHLCPGMSSDLGGEIEACAGQTPGVATTLQIEGDILTSLTEGLKKSGADRVVFAGCTPIIHKNLIEEALRLAGLNPYLYETVDLRAVDPQSASSQIADRIRMGVARSLFVSPPALREIPIVKEALVVGGGIAGLECARALSHEGYPVTVVEKERKLGGHGRHVGVTWEGVDVQAYLNELVTSVEQDERVTVLTGTVVKKNRGFSGNFVTTLEQDGRESDVSHGVTVLAPGGAPIKPAEYLYGQHKGVYLWSELDQIMIEDSSAMKGVETAVFIQCVGSRESGCSHCSNICCSFSVRKALDLKALNPEMDIYILYRDVRTLGERENIYREARKQGIIFIRYEPENKPVVQSMDGQSKLNVVVFDQILQRTVGIEADFVSLQTAIVGTGNQELADIFRINLDSNGFFAESPEKLRPVDSTGQGVFMAGLAVYPKDITESITQAKAASARALEILVRDTVEVGGAVAEVRPEKCAVCCTCVRTCPFGVPNIDHEIGAAYIDPGLCQGCGICVAECPGKAIIMSTCSDQMLTEAPSILLMIDR